jgi:hypothetical protein
MAVSSRQLGKLVLHHTAATTAVHRSNAVAFHLQLTEQWPDSSGAGCKNSMPEQGRQQAPVQLDVMLLLLSAMKLTSHVIEWHYA